MYSDDIWHEVQVEFPVGVGEIIQSQFFNQSLNVITLTYDYDIVWSFICWYKNVFVM